MRKKVILDVDTGIDDAIGIMLASRSPELEIIGITVVAGNAELSNTFTNTLKICDFINLDNIPVAAGMSKPLFRELLTAKHVHGITGLGGANLPPTELSPSPQHAVDFLISTLLGSEEQITIIATAPLTNLAMAILREPKIKDRIEEIFIMGGAIGLGNITPSAEFNIYVDPEAAHIILTSGIPITMIGLDVTNKALLTAKYLKEIETRKTPMAKLLFHLLSFLLQFHTKTEKRRGCPLHDPCAVAAAIDRDLFVTKHVWVDVETESTLTRGRTVCDLKGITNNKPNAKVATDINSKVFLKMLLDRLVE